MLGVGCVHIHKSQEHPRMMLAMMLKRENTNSFLRIAVAGSVGREGVGGRREERGGRNWERRAAGGASDLTSVARDICNVLPANLSLVAGICSVLRKHFSVSAGDWGPVGDVAFFLRILM